MGRKRILWETAVFFITILAAAACTAPAAEGVSRADSEEVESAASNSETQSTQGDNMVDLPDMGEAPEFLNEVWLNSDGPVTLASQRGKVVLLEFWTFG